jgi:hypothetical protein
MMIRKVKKIIVKLRMWYADIRGHHGKNGTMNQENGIWEDILKIKRKKNDRSGRINT